MKTTKWTADRLRIGQDWADDPDNENEPATDEQQRQRLKCEPVTR